jgi:hypothetical protein
MKPKTITNVYLGQEVSSMLMKKVLSAMIGLGLLAVPAGALAAEHYYRPVAPHSYAWRAPAAHSPFVLAQDDWHHHHDYDANHPNYDANHPDWHHHDSQYWQHHQPPPPAYNPNDYNWGGRYRYQYPPSYFSRPMPSGYNSSQRRDNLLHQRQMAEAMMQQAQARGDTGAQSRLASTIATINSELRR